MWIYQKRLTVDSLLNSGYLSTIYALSLELMTNIIWTHDERSNDKRSLRSLNTCFIDDLYIFLTNSFI